MTAVMVRIVMTGVVITGEVTVVAEVVTTGEVTAVAPIAAMNPGNPGRHRNRHRLVRKKY
jgi:hypothetical protein